MQMKYRIINLDETDSTNRYVRDIAAAGERDICVIARRQTLGRGRLGRRFESPEGGLYMSFVVQSSHDGGDGLTAKAAVATTRAIENCTGLRCGIKWVNDIIVSEKKLCGILTEGVWCGGRAEYFIVGIGVNLHGELPSELSDIATTVENEGGRVPDAEILARAILGEFLETDEFFGEYRDRQTLLGHRVTAHRGDESFDAVFEELSDDFGAVLRLTDGTKMKLSSGEISLRSKNDGRF